MNEKNLNFHRLDPAAVLPTRGSLRSCGLDIYSIEAVNIAPGRREGIRTGFAVSIPEGFYGRVAPRSGLASRHGIDVLAGVIDADYRGEVICIVINLGENWFTVKKGGRIAQLIIEKVAILEPVWDEEVEMTERATGGFGSTGI